MAYIEVINESKFYGKGAATVKANDKINFSIEEREFTVIVGPSGAGKSTLLHILGGMDSPNEGEVIIDGTDIARFNEKELTIYRREDIGFIFQNYNLIPNLNIKENIEVGAYLSDNPLDVDDILKTLGLYEHRHKLPNQLSGGQQQRTAIGRAIVKNPDILIYMISTFPAECKQFLVVLYVKLAFFQNRTLTFTEICSMIKAQFNFYPMVYFSERREHS